VQVGKGIANFDLGQRVMVFHHIPCGSATTAQQLRAVARLQESRRDGRLRASAAAFPNIFGDGLDRPNRRRGAIPDGVPFEQRLHGASQYLLKAVKQLNLAPTIQCW